MGQSLCGAPPAGYRSISVGVNDRGICSGDFIQLSLPQNLQNVVVYPGYTNQSLAGLENLPRTTALRFPLFNPSTRDSVVTILVTASENNQSVLGCVTVFVRPLRTPQVTYEGCLGREIFLFVDDPSNKSLGNLRIEWEDGTTQVVDPTQQPVVRKSFATPETNRIFTIGPAPGVTCGRSATIQVNLMGQDGYSTLKNLVTDPSDQKKVTMELSRGDQPAARGEYNLWIRRFDQPYLAQPSQQITPGKNTIQLPEEGLHCFVAYRNSYCPNNVSNEICQVILDTVQVISPTRNQISWQMPNANQVVGLPIPFQTQVERQVAQVLRYAKREDVGILGRAIVLTNFTPNARQLEDSDTDCRQPACYQVVWRTQGRVQQTTPFEVLSYSNVVCVDASTLPKPPVPEAWVSVVGEGQVQVFARSSSTSEWPLVGWEVRDRTGLLPTLGIPWLDNQSRPEEGSVCYQVRVVDACASASAWTEPLCTLHLQLSTEGELIWTGGPPFSPSEVIRYNVFAQEESLSQNQASFTATVRQYFPDVESFQSYADFSVEASSSTGRLSRSNAVRIAIQPKLFFPTAFSPNGDGYNDEWFPKGRLGRIQSFQITIFDRSGVEIWSSQDVRAAWDGTYQKRPVPTGAYGYRVRYETSLVVEERVGTLHVYR